MLFFVSRFKSTVHGKAEWMSYVEMLEFLPKGNQGLVLSAKHRLSLEDSFKNLALVAPTGSGKTTKFVIPNILNCKGSIVVTDPAGEIYKLTSGHMARRGYQIQVLQPSNLEASLFFNPLSYAESPQELKQLANTIGGQNTGNEAYWKTGAINVIFICLQALMSQPDPARRNLGELRKLLNEFGVSGEGINSFMQEYLDDRTFTEYKSFLAKDSKLITSFISTAEVALDLWSDSEIVKFSSQNNVDIPTLRTGKSIIYLIIPEDKVRYFAIMLNLFYSACFEYCIKHPQGNPVFFFLDEFGNLPPIANFATMTTTLRKRKCSISLILQALSQLETVYGRTEAQTILTGGISNKLYFSGLDLETCEYLEKVLGASTSYDLFMSTGAINDNARTVSIPLMRSHEIRMLPDDEAIFITTNKKPIKLKMLPYYKNKSLVRMTKQKVFA